MVGILVCVGNGRGPQRSVFFCCVKIVEVSFVKVCSHIPPRVEVFCCIF